MSDKIVNLKLESFFHNHKITKKASLGHFSDVVTEDDLKAISTMVHKMVMLPKYEKIKKQLQSANGIVNFVTYDEFEPLVEMIFRTSIPPSANDIYHMGQGFTLPEDYFVDAKGFFGKPSSDQNVIQAALQKLETAIQGSPKKMTKEWLKENGLDPDSKTFTSVFGEAAPQVRSALETYQRAMQELETSDFKVEIDTLFKKLDNDRVNRKKVEEIEKANKTRPDNNKIRLPEILSKDQIVALRKQLRLKRGFYTQALQNIEQSEDAELLSIPEDMFSRQREERSGNGFLSWAPEDEIRKVYEDIISQKDKSNESQMAVKFENLQVKLENYRTTDPDLIEKRQQILDFLSGDDSVQKYMFNPVKFTGLMNEFITRANQHGKMIIFKDVDDSALTTTPMSIGSQQEKVPSGAKLNNFGVLTDFVAANNANMVRDMEAGKRTTRGKRTIIMISTYPLTGMPQGSTTIEMDVTPVDEAEAKIIVESCLGAHVNDASSAAIMKMAYDIEKKYDNLKGAGDLSNKALETSQIPKFLRAAETQMAYISPEGRRTLEQMISGMGQKAAIGKVRELLATNIITKRGEDGMIASMNFDEEKLLDIMMKEFTADKAKTIPGLQLRRSKVKFEHYITKQGSKWGDKVGFIEGKVKSCGMYNQELEMYRQEIIRIDVDLRSSQFSTQTKQDKLAMRKQYEDEILRLSTVKDGLLKSIPHYIILRGKPGVGKCLGRGTPVIMFDGNIKNVEDIVNGDLLMGPDSKPRKVLSTTYGVGPLYKVSQKLGDDYICNNSHILSLQSTDKPSNQESVFISAEDFCKENKTWKHRHKGWKVGVEFSEKPISIDPYWLGLWLGDGISRMPSIMVADKDKEIAEWLQQWAIDNHMIIRKEKQPGCEAWHFVEMKRDKNGYCLNKVKALFKTYNLLQNKHIPEIYLKNSSKNRLHLLAGLIDSDGYKSQSGTIQFTNINKRLALEVLYLARSLGFRSTFSEGIKGIKKLNYTVKSYTVTIGGTLSRIPSRLSRKQGQDNPQKKSLRYGIQVNAIGEGEYFGFEIDGDRQFLLGDFTVTHNSIFGDALADLMKFPVYDVRIQDVFDKWVGNSTKNTKLLLNAVFGSRNAVFLVDEIDRVLDMPGQDSSGGGGAGEAHSTEKKVVADFLARFGDDINQLIERNVYVIMTTNHIRSIDNALLKRAKGDIYDVEASNDPRDYLKFLQTFIETERKDNPDAPWLLYGGKNTKEMWDFTMKYIRENIDLPRIAEAFAARELSFRSLSGLIKEACLLDSTFKMEFQDAISRGEPATPIGMPMTTANMLNAAELVNDDATDASQINIGIHDVYRDRLATANEAWSNIKLEEIQEPHPISGKPRKVFKLPQDFIKILEGTEQKKQMQFEVADEELEHPSDPSVKRRQKVLQPYQPGQQKDIKDLADDGMQEDKGVQDPKDPKDPKDANGPDQEKIQKGPDIKNKEKQGKVTSSSEYLYRFLIEKGVVDNKGMVISKKMEEKPEKPVENKNVIQPFDSLEQFGTYYFNNGQIMMMSIDSNVSPITFYN